MAVNVYEVLIWSCLAGIATVLGAILLFFRQEWSNRVLASFLRLAAGVMVGVVVFDLFPSAIAYAGLGTALIGILLGIAIIALFDYFFMARIYPGDSLIRLGYLIMLGIAMHDFPEGIAIALGYEMKVRTGAVIALGIGIHNIPEGMAIAAPLIMSGMSRWRIILPTILVGIITPLGTISGQIIINYQPQLLPVLLGIASGIMLYLVFFQLLPQAGKKAKQADWKWFWLGASIILLATFI
ncbi:MAG: ZIP family metal transporter [Syntrophomonadaceae bacterium]|jgi:ZIP family zinc transporter|nr:ZIP family metal transporter [Syntrophomonadaceae bacterium]